MITIGWLLLYIVARGGMEVSKFGSIQAVLFALLPLPAFVLFVWMVIVNVRQMDELERKTHLEALAVAFPLAITLVMVLGLLELAIPLSKDDWSYRHVWQMFVVFYFAGLTLAKRRYQ